VGNFGKTGAFSVVLLHAGGNLQLKRLLLLAAGLLRAAACRYPALRAPVLAVLKKFPEFGELFCSGRRPAARAELYDSGKAQQPESCLHGGLGYLRLLLLATLLLPAAPPRRFAPAGCRPLLPSAAA
jgi:hypothetical protein